LATLKTFVIVEMQSMTLVSSMWESTVKFPCQRLAVTMKKSFVLMEDTAKMIGRIRRIGLVAVGQIMMDNIVNMIKARFQIALWIVRMMEIASWESRTTGLQSLVIKAFGRIAAMISCTVFARMDSLASHVKSNRIIVVTIIASTGERV
jgi:hypothetical protein